MEKGRPIFRLEENASLKPVIFLGFTDISKKKARIFTGNAKEEIIAVEKIVDETPTSLRTKADACEILQKRYRQRKPEIIP